MASQRSTKLVAIVDDDDLMRSALQGLLKSSGLPAQTFASSEGIPQVRPTAPDCMSDRRYPYAGMSGLELQAKLNAITARFRRFLSRPRDEKNADAGLKAGAVEFLANHLTMKPCSRAFEQPWRVEPKASVHAARGGSRWQLHKYCDW